MTPSAPIVVVGAGAAGMACALAAARAGADVLLIERAKQIGGTVVQALIHTLGGLYDDSGAAIDDGLPAELIRRLQAESPNVAPRRIGKAWVLNVDPALYGQVAAAWLGAEPRIDCRTASEVTALAVAGGRINALSWRTGTAEHRLEPRAVVDATGDAALVRRIDPGLVAPGAALAGRIVALRGVAPGAVAFPRGVALLKRIRSAAANGELPPECATLWPDSGVHVDEVYLKLNLSVADDDTARMDRVLDRLLAWLRRLPEFADARIAARGALGVRDGGRIRGDYRLTEADVKTGRRFADAVGHGCWPIEHWHPEQGIRLDYLPPGTRYDIPLRALAVTGITGLYAAGKCLSAEPRAQASARVVGTCWSMGAGLGRVLAEQTDPGAKR